MGCYRGEKAKVQQHLSAEFCSVPYVIIHVGWCTNLTHWLPLEVYSDTCCGINSAAVRPNRTIEGLVPTKPQSPEHTPYGCYNITIGDGGLVKSPIASIGYGQWSRAATHRANITAV